MGEPAAGIDEAKVVAWLREHLMLRPPLAFDLVAGGHSNLTYVVTDVIGARCILRRPPLGDVPATAHDMRREHRILSGLAHTTVPVPSTIGLCEDESVTGAPFYVMQHVDGIVLRDALVAASYPEARRRAVGIAVTDVLAAVHAVDPNAVGLGELGRHDGYIARQLKRWQSQWAQSKVEDIPLVDELHDVLAEQVPEQARVSLVHGDYRLENCIVTVDGAIAAVLDWELCTLGDPLADVGLLAIYWTEAQDVEPIFPTSPTIERGFPSRAEVLDRYAEASGHDVTDIGYYIAFGYWRLACITAGVQARYLSGAMGDRTPFAGLDTQAARCARKAAAALEGMPAR